MSHDLLVLGQELAAGAPRMPGHIVGGWEYVWASWGIAWLGIALYGLSLFQRRPKE
jgi:hypothetical protein